MTSLQERSGALDGTLSVVEGSSTATGTFLAPDVQTWVASPEQAATADIEAVRGATQTNEALRRLAPSSLTVVAAVLAEDACWAEVSRVGDGEPETCVAGLTYDRERMVSRLVWLRAPLVPAPAARRGTVRPGRTTGPRAVFRRPHELEVP